MKNKLLLTLSFGLLITIVGCNKNTDEFKITFKSNNCSLTSQDSITVKKGTSIKSIRDKFPSISKINDGYSYPFKWSVFENKDPDSYNVVLDDYIISSDVTFVCNPLKTDSIKLNDSKFYYNLTDTLNLKLMSNDFTGNVPYITINDYIKYIVKFGEDYSSNYSINYSENSVTVKRLKFKDRDVSLTFDVSKQNAYVTDIDSIFMEEKDGLKNGLDFMIQDPQWFAASSTEVKKEASPITIDLFRYGMYVFKYNNDFYVPFYLFCNGLGCPDGAFYAGANLYNNDYISVPSSESPEPVKKMYEQIKNEVNDKKLFSKEFMYYTYNNIAFLMDYTFGMTSRICREPSIKGKVIKYNEFGAYHDLINYKNLLTSTNPNDSTVGLKQYFDSYIDDGGHSSFDGDGSFLNNSELKLPNNALETIHSEKMNSPLNKARTLKAGLPFDSKKINGNYQEYGTGDNKVAFVTFDGFFIGEGVKKPTDPSSITEDKIEKSVANLLIYSNKKIHDNNIKNVVIDISCNGGGDPTVVNMINSWVNGKDAKTSTYSKLTGLHNITSCSVDLNCDNQFSDADWLKDINVYCLTSNYSFSCGNMLPVILENGSHNVKFIGENTGGGSCSPRGYNTGLGSFIRLSYNAILPRDINDLSKGDNDNGVLKTYEYPIEIVYEDGTEKNSYKEENFYDLFDRNKIVERITSK